MKNIKILIMLIVVVLVAACEPEKKTLAEPSEAPDTDEDSNFEVTDSPLFLQIGARWEMESSGPYDIQPATVLPAATIAPCAVPRLAAQGTELDCVFKIPEARLYYSNLKFLVGTTMAASCPILSFSPFYYKRSENATFQPAGQDEPVDCDPTTRESDDPLCYGGAAPTMITGFPFSTGSYFNTNIISQSTFALPSENSTRWYGGQRVNYLANNTITDPTSTLDDSSPQARVGGDEWRDWSVSCTNMWGELMYKINFWIEDENIDPAGGPGADQFTDWP